MQTQTIDQVVGQFRHRLARVLIGRQLLWTVTVALLGWGTVVLFGRGLIGWSLLDWTWHASALLFVAVVLAIQARLTWRQVPTADQVRALLDGYNHAGGLVMATGEQPLPGWHIPQPNLPAIHWHSQQLVALLLLALAFFVASFFIPIYESLGLQNRTLQIEQEVAQLQEKIQTLEKVDIIPEERSANLLAKLESIHQNASPYDPARTWEALDNLQEQVFRLADAALQQELASSQSLAQAETLGTGVSQGFEELNTETMQAAFAELNRLVEKAADENELVDTTELAELLQEALTEDPEALDPQLVQEILEEIAKCKGNCQNRVGELVKARLLDPKALEKCKKCGECNSGAEGEADLLAYLEECEATDPATLILALQQFGQGNTNRGPGHSPLDFSGETPEEGAKFKEQMLPLGSLKDLTQTELLAIGRAAPKVDETQAPSTGGALAEVGVGTTQAVTQQILPRHRGAIERYFQRTQTNPNAAAVPASAPASSPPAGPMPE